MPTKKKTGTPLVSLDIAVLIVSLVTTFLAWEVATNSPQNQIPLYIFIIGITASFLLFGMVYALGRSARKDVELEEEHSRLVAAIESVPIAMVITDLKANIVLSNYEVTRILGETEGPWTLAKIEEKLASVYSIRSSYNEVLSNHRTLEEKEIEFESRHLNIYMAPVFSEKQGILGVLILIRDVTNL